MRIVIIGPARHGKDTFAMLMQAASDWTFESSTNWVADKFVRNYLAAKGINYGCLQACIDDRVNHRDLWYQACREYVKDDKSAIAEGIFAEHDIYVGIRGADELEAAAADAVIWVEAPNRIGADADRQQIRDIGNLVTASDADFIVNNDGTIEELAEAALYIVEDIKKELES